MIEEKKKATSWVTSVESTTNKLKIAYMFGDGVYFNSKGAQALYDIITDMAKKLDVAVALKREMGAEAEELRDRLATAERKLISHELQRIAGVTSKVTAREVFLHIAYLTVIIWLTTS